MSTPTTPARRSATSLLRSLRSLPLPVRLLPALALALLGAAAASAPRPGPGLPATLHATGLYVTGSSTEVRPGILAYKPVYPLWSDGATKRRWIQLPPGRAIDASRPEVFDFPPGTRLWKEFAMAGRRIETRYIERRADGRWVYATYRWNEQGSGAVLAPAGGERNLVVPEAPGGRYDLPSRNDCLACHEGAAVPVLGVSALQLSPERDPLAPNAEAVLPGDADLRTFVELGLLRRLPQALLETPPRIAAVSDAERAALGYLHGNCGHCHNDNGAPAPVKLVLAQQQVARPTASRDRVLQTTVGVSGRYRPTGATEPLPRIAPGQAGNSLLLLRMRSRRALLQMPPLGSTQPDPEGLALIERWIDHDLNPPLSATKEP
jgi:hypothetical protein